MDSHGRPVCADGHTWTHTDVLCVLTDTHGPPNVLCVLMDTHGRPVCADGHTLTPCSKNQRADMCTDGHPQTSCVCWRTPTDVLCVLNRQPMWAKIIQTVHGNGQRADSKDQLQRNGQRAESKDQRADMCTDGQPRTSCVCGMAHMDTHRRPVCADGHTRIQPTWAKITQTVHGKGQRAESKDQRADIMLSPRTNVLICVLTDTHRRHVCADGHTRTHTKSHGHPVCADGQPRMSSTDVLCVLADTHSRPVCTDQTAHSMGRVGVLSPRTNVLICVPTDTHICPVCADEHTRTHTESHGHPVCADGQPRTSRTAHVGQNHPNSPREGSAC
ncbi:unnamed protein product [Brassica rapa]|uniref:Uncharacterized protein n=1 Tax=Brassica campestris TaxID=3711 RepID=A0A8D9CVQ8_BRACM|nr:unnamed protein product [Brassica rapa]